MSLIPKLLFRASRLFWRITRPVTLGVRLVLVKDGQVYLVRHTYQPGTWFLVGGGVKRDENLHEAARREAREEVGAELGTLSLLGMYTNYFDHKSDHVAVFVCEDFNVTGAKGGEIETAAFFALDALPGDLAAGHRRRIQEFLNGGCNAPVVGMW